MTRARRNRRGFALVMADIDRFKAFNDKYGHACGDFVLEQVAQFASPVRLIDENLWQEAIDTMVAVVHGPTGTARRIGEDAPYQIAGELLAGRTQTERP